MEHSTHIPAEPATPKDAVEYLAEILVDCERIAMMKGFWFLAYLIEMAGEQAEAEVRKIERGRVPESA